ncbi:hypothetical protein Tco_1156686 [Tanacetum coccineum]
MVRFITGKLLIIVYTAYLKSLDTAYPVLIKPYGVSGYSDTAYWMTVTVRELYKIDNQEKSRESRHGEKDFEWFNEDMPIGKEFDEFCERWWGTNRKDAETKEENWNGYSPHEE